MTRTTTPSIDLSGASPAPGEDDDGLRPWVRYGLPSLAMVGGAWAAERARQHFQAQQVFWPSRYPTGIWDPTPFGLDVEDVFFEAEDGVRLHGWWIAHPRARGAVVYCHGNSGSIADRIGLYRQLRRLKVSIFAFDYRGYGRSGGEPSEDGLCADVRAACDVAAQRVGGDLSRIVLFGHSLGGAVAIDGARHRAVGRLIVQSSFTDLRTMADHLYGRPLGLLTRNWFRSIDKVGDLAMPKLFVHGTADETVPFALGEALHAAAAEPKQFLPIARGGHNDVHRHGGFRYLRTLSRFCRPAQATFSIRLRRTDSSARS